MTFKSYLEGFVQKLDLPPDFFPHCANWRIPPTFPQTKQKLVEFLFNLDMEFWKEIKNDVVLLSPWFRSTVLQFLDQSLFC